MTRKEIGIIVENGRMSYDSDFWWDFFMGTILLTMFFWAIGMLVLLKLGFTNEIMFPLLILIVCLISIKFYLDHKIQEMHTGLSKEENAELICETLKQLNWKYRKYANTIDLEYGKYILKWTYIILIPLNEKIVYSFQYHSTSQTGRFPFFIGIRRYLRRKFENKIRLLFKP